jgi:tetratricopeptide (TPR) repeat protein
MKQLLLFAAILIACTNIKAQTFIELNNQFNELFKKKAYAQAIPVGIKALAQAKKEYGEVHENFAIASHNLAEGYYALMQFKAALPLYHQAVRVYAIVAKTSETSDIALCTNNIGVIYLSQKKYDSSAIFFESSFNFFLKHSDEQYNNAIGVMNNLYDLYVPLKKYKEAKTVFTRMLPVIEVKEGIMSANYQATFANLTGTMNLLKEYGALEIWYRKILPVVQKAKGKFSKEYGDLAYQFGNCLKQIKNNESAVLYLKEAAQAFTVVAGNNENTDIALCNNDIGLLYLELKKFDSSAVYFEKAFNYFVLHTDTEYENALTLMSNLEELYIPVLDYDEAKEVYTKILPVIEKKEGLLAEKYTSILTKFINVLYKLDEYSEAELYLKNIITSIESKKQTSSPAYAEILYLLAKCLRKEEKYDESIIRYKKSITILSVALKDSSNKRMAFCQNELGLVYLAQKKYDVAAIYFEKAFNYFFTHLKEEYCYESMVTVADNLVVLYSSNNRNIQRKAICEKVLPIVEENETIFSENYCTNLYYLSNVLRLLHEYKDMEKWTNKLISCRAKLNGVNSIQYAEALDILGLYYADVNKFAEAEKTLVQSLFVKTKLKQQDTASISLTYIASANLYGSIGAYDKAYEYYNKAIVLLEKANLTASYNYITALQSLGYTYISGARFADAKTMLNRVLDIQSQVEGESFSGNAEIFVSIANAEFQLNELSAAQEHSEKAMQIATTHFGEINDVNATAKGILGLIFHKMGNSTKGIQLMEESIVMNKQIFGEDHPRVALTYTSFSLIYQEMGRYADAQVVLSKALNIQKKIYGVNHPEYALSLMNLAMVYAMQGGYDNAANMLKEAMDIYIKNDLAGTSNFIKILANLTYIVSAQGDYPNAKKLYLRTIEILDSRKDSTSYVRYMILNNLSAACLQLNETKEAVQYAELAIEMIKKSQGVKSIEYIKSTNNLLITYKKMGELGKAKTMIDELIVLCKEVLGDDADLLATIYLNAAVIAEADSNFTLAIEQINQSVKITLSNFRKNFYTLSEKEKLSWWQEKDLIFNYYPSLLLRTKNAPASMIGDFVNQQLQLKGFILTDAAASLRKARASGTKELVKLIDTWQSSRTLLSKQLAMPVSERYYKTDSLELIANSLEKNINQQASGIIAINQKNIITWQTVQATLKDDEAAVEFVHFPFYRNSNFTDTVLYAAVVIRKNQLPQFVTLGNEAQINWCLTGGKKDNKETRVNSLYRSSLKNKNNAETFAGDSLYSIIWKPLMPYLQKTNTVSYAPDGLLHKIAFHALPSAKGALLLDEFRLQQYASVRQLTESRSDAIQLKSVYLMGNADFNSLSKTASTQGVNVSLNRSISNDVWVALPGTEKEINSLQPLFTSKGVTVSTITGANATEEKFKSLNNHSPAIIHLATHGFFLPDPKNKKTVSEENAYALSDDPLMRSGIIMAGANKAWSGEKIPVGVEDGIATAYEIAQLNLSNTKLVVLSACETALGDLNGSEGVFGLQRSFKIAGVKNLIVSLWQVPDKETGELMNIFYTNLLNGNTVRESFYKAQKEMRSKYAPYSWAAFVLVE